MIDGINPVGPKRPASQNTDKNNQEEPSFVPPELLAEQQSSLSNNEMGAIAVGRPGFSKPSKKGRKSPKEWFLSLGHKKQIALIVAILVVIGGGGVGAYTLLKKPAPAPAAAVTTEEPSEPVKTIFNSPLTGVAVSEQQTKMPVIGVMIENSPDARPQAGLVRAGVVFEAIAEGGITRFLALYQEDQPDYIGPVRSVRPYYVDWLQGFDAAIAHVGGSADALAKIRNEGVKDLDQFANGGPYQRVSNRYAPHNMYSNVASLADLAKSKGWTSSTFEGFPRKAEQASATPNAKTIDVRISGNLYNVSYNYDAASNSYKRVLAGKPHVDERTKEQLSPKVVVAMVVPYSIHSNGVNSTYNTIGSGAAFVFQDGTVNQVTWEKTSPKAQITFKDAAGAPVQFNPGQTWITATGLASNVVFKP